MNYKIINRIASFLSPGDRLYLRLVSTEWLHGVSGKDKGDAIMPLCVDEFYLGWFCERGNLPALQFCIQNGASCTSTSRLSYMSTAARNGYLSIVKYLHNLGVDPKLKDWHAIRGAAKSHYVDVIHYLLCDKPPVGILSACLQSISFCGACPIAGVLLDAGADVHWNFDCAIKYAAARRDYDFVKLMIERGADPRAVLFNKEFDGINLVVMEAIKSEKYEVNHQIQSSCPE